MIHIASIFGNEKAKLWITGRKSIFNNLKGKLVSGERRIWVHVSSLGEFEQGRSIIETLRKKFPQFKIVLTFFSPSGYEIRKNYTNADYISYLPMDGPWNSNRFIDLVQPEKVLFIKYEYWHYYLSALKRRNIPVFLCSAIFRKDQLFFKWYGGWYRNMLSFFEFLFVQNDESKRLLENIGYKNVLVTGDTRFDRVYEVATTARKLEEIKLFTGNSQCLVIGSSWEPDEELLSKYINESSKLIKYIIAPHEIHKSHVERIEDQILKKTIRHSVWKEQPSGNYDVLIIDNIGMLSVLYQYGQIAYIGGGFGKGIHNILEAAAYGNPVLFGPVHQKFQEARDLIILGGAFVVKDYDGLKTKLDDLFTNKTALNASGKIAANYISQNIGATDKIVSTIMQLS